MADAAESCLLSYEGARHSLTLSSTALTLTRQNESFFGERTICIPFADIVGAQRTNPAADNFIVLTVARGEPSALKSYSISLAPQNLKAPIGNFLKSLQEKVNSKKVAGKKLLVFINPFGGTGQAPSIWKNIQYMFQMAGLEVESIVTKSIGHAQKFCEELSLTKYYGVACISGDGLLFEVVNGLLNRKDGREAIRALTLGIIPGGSGNGLAASLGALDPLIAGLNIIKGASSPLDIFSATQSDKRAYGFLSVSWATLGVIDLQSEAYRWLGALRFDIKGLVEVFSCDKYFAKIAYLEASPVESKTQSTSPDALDLHHIDNNYTVDDYKKNTEWKVLEGHWSWFLATNTPKITSSKFPISPTTSISDGCMELTVAPAMDRVELAQLLMGIDEGTLTSHPKCKSFKVKSFILEPEAKTKAPISLDGEKTDNTAIKVEMHPSLARIYCGPTK